MKRTLPAIFVMSAVMGFGQVQAAEMPTTNEFTNSIRMRFVRIEPAKSPQAGTFVMGWDGSGLPEEITNAALRGHCDSGVKIKIERTITITFWRNTKC